MFAGDNMKYGMPTLVEFNSILENYKFAKKHNLDFIELNMDLPYCQNLKKDSLSKFDIEFTMHVSETIDIASLNDHIRKNNLKEAIRQIKIGINNDIKKFTLHINSGVYFTLPDGKFFLNEKYNDIYVKNLAKSCQVLNKFAKDNNIEINFENTNIHSFTKEAINIIFKYEYLGFTLDIGHNEKNSGKAFPLLNVTNKIKHIHLHDYDGKKDHLPIGSGIIDFSKYIDNLKVNYVVIEIKQTNELIESINYIRNHF